MADKLLICSLFKIIGYHEACSGKIACIGCIPFKSDYIAKRVVDTCCQHKVNLGKTCNLCALRIKRALNLRVKELVYCLHHFGVATEKEEQKDLLIWSGISKE